MTSPTPARIAQGLKDARRERARAFHRGLHALTSLISGGRPQARR